MPNLAAVFPHLPSDDSRGVSEAIFYPFFFGLKNKNKNTDIQSKTITNNILFFSDYYTCSFCELFVMSHEKNRKKQSNKTTQK